MKDDTEGLLCLTVLLRRCGHEGSYFRSLVFDCSVEQMRP